MNASLSRFFPVAVLMGLFAPPAASSGVIYRTVALTGMQAPGTPDGAAFDYFSLPAINASGHTAFLAWMKTSGGGVTRTNNQGIWSEGSGTLDLVARSDSPAPDVPGAKFYSFHSLRLLLNSAGRSTFTAFLQPGVGGITFDTDTGIWSEGSGTLELVAREGTHAPDTPPGTNFKAFTYAPLMNAAGHMAFQAFLNTGVSNSSVWSWSSGAPALVARGGTQAPGTPPGALFDFIAWPTFNNHDRLAFSASLKLYVGGGVIPSNDQGIWSDRSGVLDLVVRSGSPAPGLPTGTQFGSFDPPVMNDSGKIAMVAWLRRGLAGVTLANDCGIWSDSSGTLALLAREGGQAPDTPLGNSFFEFSDPILSSAGRAAFHATLMVDGGDVSDSNDTGIWSEGSGTLKLVAREGSQAPGTPSGTNFSGLGLPVLNASSRTAFRAVLESTNGTITDANDAGIWAEDPNGTLTLMVREGDLFEAVPGDFRTIASIGFGIDFGPPSGGEDGRAIVFNDNFTLAFRATFTDGTQGVFTATLTAVPEPTTVALLFAATMFVPRRRP